jgi:hypothetical protein
MFASGSLSEIVSGKSSDYDKKLNFEQSISYTPDLTTLEGDGGFRFTKQIFQKPPIFDEMNMVTILIRTPCFTDTTYGIIP